MNDLNLKQISPFHIWEQESLTLTNSDVNYNLKALNTPCRMVRIKALSTNTGNIHVGNKDISSSNSAIELQPKEFVEISINNLKNVYVLAGTSGDKINFMWVI